MRFDHVANFIVNGHAITAISTVSRDCNVIAFDATLIWRSICGVCTPAAVVRNNWVSSAEGLTTKVFNHLERGVCPGSNLVQAPSGPHRRFRLDRAPFRFTETE